MREILFRGATEVGGHKSWKHGCLVENKYGDRYIVEDWGAMYYVEPETVGQYTGLQDKNGAKIFEGDVLLERYKEPDCDGREGILAEVVFHKGAFMIKEPGYEPEYTLGETHEDFEIVGNVFENAELLEVE